MYLFVYMCFFVYIQVNPSESSDEAAYRQRIAEFEEETLESLKLCQQAYAHVQGGSRAEGKKVRKEARRLRKKRKYSSSSSSSAPLVHRRPQSARRGVLRNLMLQCHLLACPGQAQFPLHL